MSNPVVESDIQRILASPLPWNNFAGSTVVISGAGGFLAAYLVETLLLWNLRNPDRLARIVGLVRDPEKARARFSHHENRADLEFHAQDISESLRYDGPADYIVHAASPASPKYYGADPVGTLTANIVGAKNLLDLARTRSCRSFLLFSSAEVYGQLPDHLIPNREIDYGDLDPVNVRSCYAESKRMAENMCVSWNAQYGTPAKIIRLFHTYGPGMALDDGRVFADFVAAIVKREPIRLSSDGLARRAFCYIADAIRAAFTVLLRGQPGEAYNIGNDGAEISIKDLALLLVSMFPGQEIELAQAVPVNGYLTSPVSRSCPDITKLRGLGWEPATGIRDGFYRTVKSFSSPQ